MTQQLLVGKTRLTSFTSEWKVRPFPEVMTRLNAKRHQVPASLCRGVGRLPVVDQGQKPVIGYTDRVDVAFDPGEDGVIVFGDHTCITKFVDFKFAVGAEGTQLLKAAAGNLTRFLAYALEAEPVVTTGYNRHFKFLWEKVLPAPEFAEQLAITGTLAGVDDLIGTLERLIAKKQAIKQGMMQQLLTGKTRLPGFTEPWSEASLGSVATVTMGQSPAGSSYNSDGNGTLLVQGNADIRDRLTYDRIWTTVPTKRCEAGDVLLTVRAPVGYTAVASKECCLGRGVCALRAGSDNRFLFHALIYAEPRWMPYEQGSTFTAVNSNQVCSFELVWPTDRAERAAIAEALDDADTEITKLRARLTKARAIKAGMMQELLTGRIRLPVRAAV